MTSQKSLPIRTLMRRLARNRPAFHSEADFQLAFGRALEQEFWDDRVRLEYRIDPSQRRRVDITIFDKKIVFELKYRTRGAQLEHLNERFSLPHQGAYPATRFEFLKDIGRIEAWRRDGRIRFGYAIFLTNDLQFWKPKPSGGFVDAQFRLHDGAVLEGLMGWSDESVRQDREDTVRLDGKYRLKWEDYSEPSTTGFRYLSVEVDSG